MKGSAAPERPIERGGRGEARRDAARDQWTETRVGDLCRLVNGSAFKPSDWSTEGVPIIRIQNLNDADKPYNYWAGDVDDCVRVRRGDILLAWSGTPGTSFGAHIWDGEDGVLNQHIFRVDLTSDEVTPAWFVWAVNFRLENLIGRAHGAVGLAHVTKGEVQALEIPLPPLAEQERIAGRLTEQLGAVERARAAAAQRLAAAQALPAALLRAVFGDPLPFDASPLAPSTPTKSGWKWHRLTSLARLATGHTPSRRCPEYWNGDIPWIQLPDIRALDGRVAMDTSEHTNALGIENSAAVRLPAGTVCLSRTASVGFVTIMGREMATSQDFVNWVCGPDLSPSFLMHLFIACRKPIRDLGSGAVHHTIYFPTVEQFSVCVPDLPTQRRLAADLGEQLAAAEGVIARCREELAAIEALPAALLRDAFGGAEARE